MKLVLVCLFTAVVCTSFGIQQTKTSKLTLSAVIISRERRNMSLRITLTNNTSDTIKYVSWNCSWQNSYSIDNDNWKIFENLCYKNGRETFQIPPHQSESKILYLEKLDVISNPKNSEFKIGFHFITPEDEAKIPPRKFGDSVNNGSIIWSNIITTKIFTKSVN